MRERPQRMLLAREAMPRYARLSPESANIFDNLHMLHGFAYDILAYEGWTLEEKRRELVRVIEAMSYQPGDEALARKFSLPYPEMDPRVYADWMRPAMSPDGAETPPAAVMEQARKKFAPGVQEGEHPGSLMEALAVVAPGMKHDPAAMAPGAGSSRMVEMMLAGWRKRHGSMSGVAPIPMDEDPTPSATGQEMR